MNKKVPVGFFPSSIGLIFTVAAVFCSSPSAAGMSSPWTSYFSAQDLAVPWAKTIRGIGRKKTGASLMDASGRITANGWSVFTRVENKLVEVLKSRDVIVQIGGLRSARNQEKFSSFMELIKSDRAASWKETVYKQAVRVAKINGAENGFYWQIGNEINSRHYSRSLRGWAGLQGNAHPDDAAIIKYYVEYFLAPTVEALESASLGVYGSRDKIQILLGTIANAKRESSRQWLDELLDYEIRGDYAESLAGKRVYELVDIVGIHYLVTLKDVGWVEALDEIHGKWIGKGRVRGIWATEELGKKRGKDGRGASTAIRVAARYIHWWNKSGVTPEESRCNFWGWTFGKSGGSGFDGIQTLYDFFGDTPLVEIETGLTSDVSGGLESYLFKSASDPSKRAVIAFPRGKNSRLRLQNMTMKSAGWSADVNATVHFFSVSGHDILPVSVEKTDDAYRFTLAGAALLKKQAVIMMFLRQKRG
ncbi:MAG: hypothetical protein IEMM0002_0933 [bacterium]|nr:MAG: hypothetical protein IEMM0002_0933 [bacterium]